VRDALFDVSRDGTAFGPADVASALAGIQAGQNVDYRGASGPVDFDDYGNVKDDYIVWQVSAASAVPTFKTVGAIGAVELEQ
jgi:hypothetical protein